MRNLSTPLFALLVLVLAVSVACEVPPRFVRQSSEVDAFLARKSYASACVGLKADDPSLRAFTAMRLAAYPHIRVANHCVCEALYDANTHTVDLAVAEGLAATRRDDLAACLAPALQDGAIKEKKRAQTVEALAAMDAPGSYQALEALASSDPNPAVRAHAARALRPSAPSEGTLLRLLAEDEDPSVRAAAAEALTGHRGKAVVDGVVAAALSDGDGQVRAAALSAVVELKLPKTDEMVCKAMLEDPDERVRDQAVRAFHGTKRVSSLQCLERRMKQHEPSGTVRASLLAALGASPSDKAALMLCEHIHLWMRLYVKDEIADRIEGANIVEVQNNRDWERSYDCVAKALRQGGLSCYARNHLGHWMNELGGRASTPWCPGMARL